VRLRTEANVAELPNILSEFLSIVGWSAWNKRRLEFEQQLQHNFLLKNFIHERHALEIALFDLMKRRNRLPRRIESATQYSLLTFMFVVVELYRQLSAGGKRRLAGRLQDGLQSENGLVSLRHEMRTAVHFLKRGFDLDPIDLETGGGVDFLAQKDGVKVEIECKLISADIGSQIHQRRMIELSHQLFPVLKDALRNLKGGVVVTITLRNRLTGQLELHRCIADTTRQALKDHTDISNQGDFDITLSTFNLAQSPLRDVIGPDVDRQVMRHALRHVEKNPSSHAFCSVKGNTAAILVVVESSKRNRILDRMYDQLKHATKGQFSGTRPAILAAELTAISSNALLSFAASEHSKTGKANPLQLIVTRLFDNPERHFLYNVTFVTPGEIERDVHESINTQSSMLIRSDVVRESGPSYSFVNTNCHLAAQLQKNFL